VILVAPASGGERESAESGAALLRRYLLAGGFSLKDVVARVVGETGLPKSEVYAEALRLKASLHDR
jgi:16S rRNA (cytidine1402-2'-O)-methyltransferase